MRRIVRTLPGDTLIEVMLSISIFAFVAMITINLMNNGINTAQRTLEAEMARNEIDAQAEALRFIHNSYVSEQRLGEETNKSQFRKLWERITEHAKSNNPASIAQEKNDKSGDGGKSFDINDMDACSAAYGAEKHLDKYDSFIINTRLIVPKLIEEHDDFKYLGLDYSEDKGNNSLMDHMIVSAKGNMGSEGAFAAPALYPRIIYKNLYNASQTTDNAAHIDEDSTLYNDIARAEGVWIDVVGNNDNVNSKRGSDYYDFYIRTCWHGAGMRTPSTITTVVRLYNPGAMK